MDQKGVYAFKPFVWKEEKLLQNEDTAPIARSGHRIVHHKGKIYSFGGYNPEASLQDSYVDEEWITHKPLLRELWELNLVLKKWRKIDLKGNAPLQMASHTASLCHLKGQTKMIVFGGTGMPFGSNMSTTLFACDLDNDLFHWDVVSCHTNDSDNLPLPLYGQAVCYDTESQCLYAVGGTSGFSYFMDVHKFDFSTQQWELVYKGTENLTFMNQMSQPKPRYRHEAVIYGGHLFVIGGGTATTCEDLVEVHAFNLQERKWVQLQVLNDKTVPIVNSLLDQFPPARRCHSVVKHGKYAYLIGGYDDEEVFDELWRLDLSRMIWKLMPFPLPTPVYFHSSAITDEGKIVTFGGVDDLDTNSRTDLVQTCYIQICSLRQMAWEAINFYFDLQPFDKSYLVCSGVPVDLVEIIK